MEVLPYCPGGLAGNSYLLRSEKGSLLVDAGLAPGKGLRSFLEKEGAFPLLAILLTHGHFDHMGGLLSLPKDVPLYLGEEDLPFLGDPRLNGTLLFREEPLSLSWEKALSPQDGEEVRIGGLLVRFLKVPYHTPGSLAFYLPEEGILFSGDALFRDGVGRSDLPGGEPRKEEGSLRKILSLPGETAVYPGHGRRTTIFRERGNLFPGWDGR